MLPIGDDYATVAAIAKQALLVDKSLGEENVISFESNSSESGHRGKVSLGAYLF